MKPGAACLTSNPALRAFLKTSLKGFALKFYPTAAAFLGTPPSKGLVVIDSELPDMAGADLAAVLRRDKRTSRLLLVLTGAGAYSPEAVVLFLNSGADEYFRFPPDAGLFRARLLNLISRADSRAGGGEAPAEFSYGALKISPDARTASVGGAKIRLTALEFDMLVYFLGNQGRIVSRSVLLEHVWKDGLDSGPRAVDKRIEALRRKLGKFGSKLGTVFGLGYIFKL